jgi:short-subunit dehydrogenase
MAMQWKNSTALVTGASSGIGAEFAGQLAAAGVNLVLVARRADRLEALRGRLLERHPGLRVDVMPADLAAAGATADLAAQLREAGLHIDVLVNSVGVGFHRPFADEPADEVAACRRSSNSPDLRG